MIEISQLAEQLQEQLNNTQFEYVFNIVSDTAEFKKPTRNGNNVTEYINGLLVVNGSDVTTLNTGALVSTLNCSLRLIMRMKGFEDDVYIETNNERKLESYGDRARVKHLRNYLDDFFHSKKYGDLIDNDGKNYVVSTVYDFAQSGVRGQVEHLGDSYTFSVNIFYMIVQQGINTRSATFILDGVVVPYQSMTTFRTPTMDGNVYANTTDGATKNLASQSTFSISFELPALNDDTTTKMFNYLFDGELNQAHLLTVDIGGKTNNYLVSYGENKLIGETILNLGQSMSLVECPNIYELIHFSDDYYIYCANAEKTIIPPENAQVYSFNNGFITEESEISADDYIVSTLELSEFTEGEKV